MSKPVEPGAQPRNLPERERAPAAPAEPGEQRGKRTNEERNDPEREPGAGQGRGDAG